MNRKKEEDLSSWIEGEVMKIYAIADVLSVIIPCDIERNTLAALGCIVAETAEGIYESVRELL